MDLKILLIPVLLSGLVWPGTGQLYNREFRKGLILIALTFLLGLSLFMSVGTELTQSLPQGASTFDWAQAREASTQVLEKNSDFLLTFNILMTLVWIYSTLDAYWGARERQKSLSKKKPSSQE